MAIKIKNKGDNEPENNEGQDEMEGQGSIPPAGGPGSGLNGFERAGFTAAAWIEDNRPLFFGMIGAALVAALAIVLGVIYVRSQQEEASNRISEGIAAYEYVVEGDPFLESLRDQEGVSEPDQIFETNEEKWQVVYASAENTLADFDRGPVAVTARMVKGAAALNSSDYEEAERLYREVLADDGATDEVMAFAHMGLANSLAAQGDLDGAEQAWNAFAELQPDRQAYADFEIARMVERHGDADDARERYEQFIEAHPDSIYLNEVERRQALL